MTEKNYNKFYTLIYTAPTTNLRLLSTLLLSIGTGIRYWAASGVVDSWQPSWEWLAFLAAMAGIDVVQHNNKRKTSWRPGVIRSDEVVVNEKIDIEQDIG